MDTPRGTVPAPADIRQPPKQIGKDQRKRRAAKKTKPAPPPSPDDWIGIDEFAYLLGVARRTIYVQLDKDAFFPRPFRYLGKLRWERKTVLEYRAVIARADQIEYGETLGEPLQLSMQREERKAAKAQTQ